MGRITTNFARWRNLRRFRRQCTRVGEGIRGRGGPVYIDNEGILEIGDNFGYRSRPHNMIDIWVGTRARLTIGNNVGINQGTRIGCSRRINIGDDCIIGDECVILDTDFHGMQGRIPVSASVHLERNVWLASRVMVLRGVTIGEGSVIAAGAVVTRSIPPHVLAGGVPARVIKQLDEP